jgi:protein-tyrosine-phosphatase
MKLFINFIYDLFVNIPENEREAIEDKEKIIKMNSPSFFKRIINWFLPKRTILFVCTGNTCRSPMAAAIFNYLAQGTRYRAYSAGVAARDGQSASANAVLTMREMELNIDNHKSRQVDASMLDKAFMVYGLTATHAAAAKRMCPEAFAFNLGDVSDPYGGDLDIYRKCAEQIYNRITYMKELLP